MISRRKAASAMGALVAVALVASACGGSSSANSGGAFKGVGITGAGATFPAPMYQKWAASFVSVESGAKVNYQSIGSGGGVQQFTAQTVDFGASDVPLQTDEISALPDKNYIEFPTCLGAVVMAYHVSGLPASGLKLDGPTVADIYMGKVKTWNDPEIAGQNPGVNLPTAQIQVAHRSDESGTTAVFTNWLAKESPEWSTKVGAGKAVQWPVGSGGNGNEGVAGVVAQTDDSIGYLSYDFAVSANLSAAQIKAPSGSYVAPSIQSISAGAGALTFPIQPDTNILDSTAPGAYPIASTTYVFIYTHQNNQSKAQTLVDFWTWALTKGQSETTSINYAPLPADFAKSALQQLPKITVNGKPVKASSSVAS